MPNAGQLKLIDRLEAAQGTSSNKLINLRQELTNVESRRANLQDEIDTIDAEYAEMGKTIARLREEPTP